MFQHSSMIVTNNKTSVGTSSYEYDSIYPVLRRVRAVVSGNAAVKEHDRFIDTQTFTNLLVPFSPNMTQTQYNWFKARAELPGLTTQYAKVLLAGLLRKPPQVTLPESAPEEALSWIMDQFTEDNRSLVTFLDQVLWEELTTTNGWIVIDFPKIDDVESLSDEELAKLKPYPVLWKAEEVINFTSDKDPRTGMERLSRVVFRFLSRDEDPDNQFHPKWVPTVADHYLNEEGNYAIQIYKLKGETVLNVSNGIVEFAPNSAMAYGESEYWEPIGEPIVPLINGNPFRQLLCFRISGDLQYNPPFLQPLVEKEIALYNKVSCRNHLLYSASTYTPVVYSDDVNEEEFEAIQRRGLGSWLKVSATTRIEPVTTPVDALSDLNTAIEQGKDEMALLGIRILNPEDGQSGISIEIRNSVQIAQLGLLNTKISQTFKDILAIMLSWRLGENFSSSDIQFQLSADFDPTPMGEGWVRTVTEWYQSRLIPRSTWISYIKRHDMLPPEYDDAAALEEIQQDPVTMDQFGGGTQIQEE